jgi:hypothetical protein
MQPQRQMTAWAGWAIFAGVMMIILGIFSVISGLVAIFNDDWFLVTERGLVLNYDYTVWGWVHLVLGIIIAAAGAGVLGGRLWARALGIVLAGLSAVFNLAFIAAYPVWSVIIIAIDVFVIYALAVHGDELKAAERR